MALSTRLVHDDELHRHHLHLSAASLTRPSRLLNSFLLSTITTANKLLASVGSAACQGARWRARDHVRYVFMMATCVTVWGLRVLMDMFPSLSQPRPQGVAAIEGHLGGSGGGSGVAALVVCEQEAGGWGSETVKSRAVGRALSHVLALLNELPATSRKYDFTLALAERIIDDNATDGHPTLLELNRSALTSAFARTSDRLLRLLQGSHASDAVAATWPSRALRLFPLGSHLASYYDGALAILLGPGEAWRTVEESRQQQQQQQMGLVGALEVSRSESVEAEKLSRELLWITRKMRGCSCAEEAIVRWSFASGLASLSLTAHQRVQGPILMISSILFRDMAEMEWEAPREVRFRILALWLPLFCYAGRGVASPVLTGPEKREMERVIEGLISALPWSDQEVILANWLEDFTSSDSDWPNLQNSYDQWCNSSRKYLL